MIALTRGARPLLGPLVCLALCAVLLAGCAAGEAKREATGMGVEPKSSPADLYVNMAAAYYQRGQLDAALERGLRALDEDRHSANAHYMLAIIYRRLGKQVEAEHHFGEALALEPDNPEFLNAQGTMLCADQRYKAAIDLFQRAVANPLYKTPEVALMNASDCSQRANHPTDAERYLRESLSRNANYPPALLAMARLSYERDDAQTARDYLARYGRVAQPTPAALLLAYRVERKLGDKAAAKTLADVLRKRFPDAPQVMEL
ncbi:MAG: type IV pilus biogenesis/stability protein PilW [Thiohalocapsa sp.]|jgi:type IV pilus assembly protein PilF|uniref:type IV pilus biogenesis/stability protein PilW n=1 Tax=Thiohalocapsa sp. TaxID=2497641 RepID=UPI0025DAFB2F|nr:type IV pilus biogenesis/stability protein PilW [Thiohalocapsa sp.]MCG6940743.1 type IV pilus biogenesis/stability protein PilW [Thiohalocapsa sp.]